MGQRIPEFTSRVGIATPATAPRGPDLTPVTRAVERLGAQAAAIGLRIQTARINAEANTSALRLRSQLLEETDRIINEVDPNDAEAAFDTALSEIKTNFGDAPPGAASDVVADLDRFALTQRFKVRAAARARNVALAKAATLESIESATRQYGTADSDLERDQAQQSFDASIQQAVDDRIITPVEGEQFRQAQVVAREQARVAHLINIGRPDDALAFLDEGTIDLPPQERLTERQRAASAVESQHTGADRALRELRDGNHIERMEQLAVSFVTGVEVPFTLDDIVEQELSAAQFQELARGLIDPTSVFGTLNSVSDTNDVFRLITKAGHGTLTVADVLSARLNVEDFRSFTTKALAASPPTSPVFRARFDQGTAQIRAAYGGRGGGVIDALILGQLPAEEQLQLNQDLVEFETLASDRIRADPDITPNEIFDLAVLISERASRRKTAAVTQTAGARFLPPVDEWSFVTLTESEKNFIVAFELGQVPSKEAVAIANAIRDAKLVVRQNAAIAAFGTPPQGASSAKSR